MRAWLAWSLPRRLTSGDKVPHPALIEQSDTTTLLAADPDVAARGGLDRADVSAAAVPWRPEPRSPPTHRRRCGRHAWG